MEEREMLSLTTLFDGAIPERFDLELKKILANLEDPNCDFDATREIVLKVKFKGNQDRDVAWMGFQIVGKPAPLSTVLSQAIIGYGENGEIEAYEIKPHRQGQLPLSNTVRPIRNGI